MNGNKVLVSGGFGNLGSYIVKYLINLNYDVTILTRKEKYRFENLKYKVIECDIVNLEELQSKLNCDFDFCVHTASFNEFFLPNYPKKALEINTLGTRNLLEVLKDRNVKNFIYFSTFHVYGTSSGIVNEDRELNPKNDYASTHLFAEYYIKQFGYTHNLKYTILRLTNSYGTPTFKDTDKWYLVINDLVKMVFEKKRLVLNSNGKAKRDFIYMGDVANIVDKLLKVEATNEIYNLSSKKTYEVIDLAKKVQMIYNKRYSKTVEIEVNRNDLTKYDELCVENKKLNLLVNFKISDEIDNEIEKIFDLLEKK